MTQSVSQKVMESGSRRRKGSTTVSLFLSDRLRKLRYGYEYGALEVKNHLEKVLFSDIVSTVMIVCVTLPICDDFLVLGH